MEENICMLSKPASSGVELASCQKTDVADLNGVILLQKLEAQIFQRYKQLTWELGTGWCTDRQRSKTYGDGGGML